MLYILLVHMYIIGHGLFGKVWKFRTIGRTYSIDTAQIRFQIKKLARSIFIHPFSLPVFKQPFLLKLLNGHIQMPGNTLQIFEGIGWCHITAAIGTGQAINFCPYLCIYAIGKKIQIPGRIVFHLGKKTPELRAVPLHIISELSSDIRHTSNDDTEGKRILKGKCAALIFVCMRTFFILAIASLLVTACNNNGGGTAKTFCDTACKSDSFNFKSTDRYGSSVSISVKNCEPDSISWTHGQMETSRMIPFKDLTNQDVRLNASAISCVIKDTSHAWLTFNDCITGRGFLFKLPFNKSNNITKILGALNSFDPKFVVAEDLRAYTDRGSIFVVDINTGNEEVMTFKETYDIDFNKVHDMIDSINVTHKRIYVKLLKNGQEVPLEKNINL